MHARSGGSIEVMGLMQGKVQDDTIIVMDAYALPVEGTETRVNAQQQGYEYMVEYLRLIQKVGRVENAIGWYHSHPGYGCWLSGIDVSTQMLNQQFQEPFLAVVVRFSFLFSSFLFLLTLVLCLSRWIPPGPSRQGRWSSGPFARTHRGTSLPTRARRSTSPSR